MKIEKKHIIIAIVVAVAAWLLWKRRSSADEVTASGSSTVSGADSLDYILSHVTGLSTEEKIKIRQLYRQAEANAEIKQSIIDAAYDHGRTYAQQVVGTALWNMYTTGGNWNATEGGDGNVTWSHVNKIMQQVDAL